jgi:hypothetical protein
MTTDQLTDTVLEWFRGLDYEFMVLHVIICYGLYYSENMRWIVEYFSPIRKKGRSKAVWLIGGILALLEMFRVVPFFISGGLNLHNLQEIIQKFVAIFHSYVVVQVFVDPIVSSVHKWVGVFRKVDHHKKEH